MKATLLRNHIAALLTGLLLATTVFALDLTAAKERGLVGETDTGYLAAVATPTEEVSALVKDINLKRRTHYQSIARDNNIAITDVELLAGKKAIEKTPPGQYVQVSGQWQKK